MRSALKVAFLALVAAALAALPLQGFAQTNAHPATEKKPAVEKKAGTASKAKSLPFQGTLSSVDTTAKTLTVGQRTFQITSETKLFQSDHHTAATLSAATPGEHVSGSYRKSDDGKLTAVSVYFGGKAEGKASGKQKAPAEKPPKTTPAQ